MTRRSSATSARVMAERVMRWTIAVTACVLTATWSVPRAGAAQGDSGLSPKILAGEIESSQVPHPGISVRRGRAVALVDAPVDRVLAVVENYGGYAGFLPHFEKSQVLSQRGSSALVYVQVSILHGAATIWAQLKLRPQKATGETRVIEGKMMKGNVKHFEARWEVTPYGPNQTLVSFELLVDPDLPLPSGVVSTEVQKSARKTIRALRTVVGHPAAGKKS